MYIFKCIYICITYIRSLAIESQICAFVELIGRCSELSSL